jgi:hypothetical protein
MDHEIFSILAIDHPSWTIPWAGLGAVLLGVGGCLSGIAAVMTARNRGRDETTSVIVPRADDGGRSGISDSDSDESRDRSSDENSDD